MVDYISIPTGGYQYVQLGYFLLCASVNKKMILIIITIIIIIIIIFIIIIIIIVIIIVIIIIIINSGAPLLGLPKSKYYCVVLSLLKKG